MINPQFKKIILVAGIGFALFILVIIFTAPDPAGKSEPTTEAQRNAQTSGDQSAQPNPSPATSDNDKAATLPLPDGFRRFTNKQHGFSVGYPAAWGSPYTQAATDGSTLRANTKEVDTKLGSGRLAGTFNIALYTPARYRIDVQPGNPQLQILYEKQKLVWKVVSAAANQTDYRVGNTYPAKTITNPAGLKVYDFTWNNANGARQGRLVFESRTNIVEMALPYLVGANPERPTSAELKLYEDFVRDVIDTVYIPN